MTAALRFSQPSGQIALAVAGFMARPMHALAPAVQARLLGDVNGIDLRSLAQSPLGAGAVQSYLADVTGSARLTPDGETLNQLRSNERVLAALQLALAPLERLFRVNRFLVGAICRDQIRSSLLKTDREACAALLGVDVQTFATRHAAMFYPALGKLVARAGMQLRRADGTAFEQHPVNDFATGILSLALKADAPLAASILLIRMTGQAEAGQDTDPLSPEQVVEVHKIANREAAG